MAQRVNLGQTGLPVRRKTFAPKVAAGVTIDGEASIKLTMQYDNVMIGSDFANGKWDIL